MIVYAHYFAFTTYRALTWISASLLFVRASHMIMHFILPCEEIIRSHYCHTGLNPAPSQPKVNSFSFKVPYTVRKGPRNSNVDNGGANKTTWGSEKFLFPRQLVLRHRWQHRNLVHSDMPFLQCSLWGASEVLYCDTSNPKNLQEKKHYMYCTVSSYLVILCPTDPAMSKKYLPSR